MIPITLNPQAAIEERQIDAENRCIIVDDFLADPKALVDYAMQHATDFEEQAIGYPGVLLDVEFAAMANVHRFLRSEMSRRFGFLKGDIRLATYLSMATRQPDELAPLQRLCHSDPRERNDRRNYAGLVYLFADEELGGTGFYRWTRRDLIEKATALELEQAGSSLELLQSELEMYREAPQYMNGTNEVAELLLEVPAKFNRLVFYSGDIPHSAHVPHPERLSTDFSMGRLTLNCFASVRPK